MPLPFDATLKTLIEQYAADWVRLSGQPVTGPVTVIDADVSTVSALADRVIYIGGDRPWILHIELQVSRDSGLPSRLLRYNVLLSERHGVPVLTILILLRPAADDPTLLTGQVVRELDGRGAYLDFRYEIVRVQTLSPETFLQSGLGLLPLAPLAKVTKRGLPKLVQQMEQRINVATNRAQAADLWLSTYVLMGLRFSPEVIAEALKGVRDLEESSTYQLIINKGREQGREEGRAEGEARGLREALLRIGRKRLGDPTREIQDAIAAINDMNMLQSLIERVLEVENWAELFPLQNA